MLNPCICSYRLPQMLFSEDLEAVHRWFVECPGCGRATHYRKTEEAAEEAWNKKKVKMFKCILDGDSGKVCKTCGEMRSLDSFQKDSTYRCGHTSECKECQAIRRKDYRNKNKNRIKARNAEYYLKNRDKCTERCRNYNQTENGKMNAIARLKRYREAHREQRPAQVKAQYHIKAGHIKRLPCEICGSAKSHAHHPNYDDPLCIIFLCPQHHKEVHMTGGELWHNG